MTSSPRWFWIDIETTGLDPETCVILQVACVVTDAELDVLDQYTSYVRPRLSDLTDTNSNWIDTAHGTGYGYTPYPNAGLTAKLANLAYTSGDDLRNVERAMMRVALKHFDVGEVILAGNSVHFDRRFIVRHMPGFAALLHHRMLDVTSLQLLADDRQPVLAKMLKEQFPAAHTAVEDINMSIEKLKLMFKNGFIA